jgi:hypothetical protein
MITVPMGEHGPDVELIEELVAAGPAIKGMCACLFTPTRPAPPFLGDRAASSDANGRMRFPSDVGKRICGAR